MTFCIFRTDRIGDVVLTLPLATAIKRYDPSARVLYCVRDYTAGLVRLCPDVDDVIGIPDRDVTLLTGDFPKRLRELAIDAAIFAFPRPGLVLAAVRAGIPQRVGTAYRTYSPMFTHRRKEHRRGGGAHEREYNLGLLGTLGIGIAPPPLPTLTIPKQLDQKARVRLGEVGIGGDEPFVVLHPGSGGSAKDWPLSSFAELGAGLLRMQPDLRVLITGGMHERELVLQLQSAIGIGAVLLPEAIPLPSLAAILNRAALVVANSTGPLHIATAVGRPVIGLYPFLRDCHPRRWGPLGDADIFTPTPQDGCPRCAAEHCDEHDDMRRIDVQDVLRAALRRLNS